jgi:hypothetical protein
VGECAVGKLRLISLGLPTLGDHTHYYRAEFDEDARRLIDALDWHFTPLRPEDEQRG